MFADYLLLFIDLNQVSCLGPIAIPSVRLGGCFYSLINERHFHSSNTLPLEAGLLYIIYE
jgi:hypothetical protein